MKGSSENNLLKQNQFNEFLKSLELILPSSDFSDETKDYQRAMICFKYFIENKWTVDDYELVMKEFTMSHYSPNWMIADFFRIYNEKIKEPRERMEGIIGNRSILGVEL